MSNRDRRRSQSPRRVVELRHDRGRDRESRQRGPTSAPRFTKSLPGSTPPFRDPHLPQMPEDTKIPSAGQALPRTQPLHPQGQQGRNLLVITNHFRVLSLPKPDETLIWRYRLRFLIPPTSQRRGIDKASKQQSARAMLKALSAQCFGENFVFDGVSKGYSPNFLLPTETFQSVVIDLEGHSDEKPNQIQIDLRLEEQLYFANLVQYLQESHIGLYPNDIRARDCIVALTAIMHDFPANHLKMFSLPTIGAYFKRWASVTSPLPSTGGVLEAIRGMIQSVSIVFGGQLTVNVDTRCSAFFVPGPCLLDVAMAFAGLPPGSEPPDIEKFLVGMEALIGMGFNVKHGNRTDRTYWVKRITSQSARNREFTLTEQDKTIVVTVERYFAKRYGIKLKFPHLPLIETRMAETFPLELCFVAPDIRYKEPLPGKQTSDFIAACTTEPKIRVRQINTHLAILRWHEQTLLKACGISIATSMLELKARVLTAPTVVYRTGTDNRPPIDGSWNLMGKKFYSPKAFKSWGLLYLPGKRTIPDQELQSFCRSMVSGAQILGLGVPSSPPAFNKADMNGALREHVETLLRRAAQAFQEKPILLILLHEGHSPSIYKAFKNICDLEGYPSQVMIAEKALKPQGRSQYIANIAMKVNVKLGGINHHVPDPFFKEPTMLMAADVSHPSSAELRRLTPPPSYAALVGSIDNTCARYSAVTMGQPSKQELITTMPTMFDVLINRFKVKTTVLPKQIIYWRDGIGETQLQAFKETEIQALLDYRKEHGLKFRLTVILCLKRHHTRFFPKDPRDGDRRGNVPPGTMVENGVHMVDFFAQTQKVIQGVGRPTRYSVVYDEMKLSMSDVQRLVMSGCLSYPRATRSVGLHTAVYHADLVAEKAKMHLVTRGNETILKEVHEDLRETMWWQ